MKKFSFLLFAVLFLNSAIGQTLTKEERKSAIKYLKSTSKDLSKSLKGLSTAQLNFRESADRWSAQDCLYHIAFSEGALRGALDGALAAAPDPVAKAALKSTDEQILKGITTRDYKVKTAAPFEPLNTGFKTFDEAMSAFKAKRAMLIDLVKTSNKDMRNHIVTLPFGKMDAYQFVQFIGGHSNRHTQQIEEVKASAGYPKM